MGFVQGRSTTTSGVASVALAFSSAVTAGNLLVAAAQEANTGTASCTDSVNGAYSVANRHGTSNTANDLVLLYHANTGAGTPTVTYTLGSSGEAVGLAIGEYSGVATSTPLDTNGATEATGATSITSASQTSTGTNGDLLIGTLSSNSQNVTVSNTTSGWSVDVNNSPNATMDIVLASRTQATAGAFTTTFSVSGSAQDLCVIAASFKLAASTSTAIQTAPRRRALAPGPALRAHPQLLVPKALALTFASTTERQVVRPTYVPRPHNKLLIPAQPPTVPGVLGTAFERPVKPTTPFKAHSRLLAPQGLALTFAATLPLRRELVPGPVLRARSRLPQGFVSGLAQTIAATFPIRKPIKATKFPDRARPRTTMGLVTAVVATVVPTVVRSIKRPAAFRAKPSLLIPKTLARMDPSVRQISHAITRLNPITKARSRFGIGVPAPPIPTVPSSNIVKVPHPPAAFRAHSRARNPFFILLFQLPAVRPLKAVLRRTQPTKAKPTMIVAVPGPPPGAPPTILREEQ